MLLALTIVLLSGFLVTRLSRLLKLPFVSGDIFTGILIGLALIAQERAAIGLAFLGRQMLEGANGNLLLTIILASCVFYKLIGSAGAKVAPRLPGTIEQPACPALPKTHIAA